MNTHYFWMHELSGVLLSSCHIVCVIWMIPVSIMHMLLRIVILAKVPYSFGKFALDCCSMQNLPSIQELKLAPPPPLQTPPHGTVHIGFQRDFKIIPFLMIFINFFWLIFHVYEWIEIIDASSVMAKVSRVNLVLIKESKIVICNRTLPNVKANTSLWMLCNFQVCNFKSHWPTYGIISDSACEDGYLGCRDALSRNLRWFDQNSSDCWSQNLARSPELKFPKTKPYSTEEVLSICSH